KIPIKIAPLTFNASNTAMIRKPNTQNNVEAFDNEPNCTNVAGLSTTKPDVCKPMNAKYKPIPAAIDERKDFGIPSMIQVRSPVAIRIKKIIPETNTPPNACCQVKPIVATIVKAKNALGGVFVSGIIFLILTATG